ncbi:endonuclease/exonuclease/phosphatase family protein [Thermopolyspora sp. NPDC052614]|uniref:endonuclease/exonuclease/phosphatase family protein n=1 Tax=Thermopolyspora sp. NPDC052614 TaxID=3155682 RepID=UPI00342DF34E
MAAALAVAGVAALGLAAPAATAATAAARGPVILSYNVCGGSCANRLSLADWTSRMVRRADLANADVILFQELCRGQYDTLRRELAGRYDARWVGTMSDNEGCGKQWGSGADSSAQRRGFGLGVFVKGVGSIREERVWWLPNQDRHEPRALLCVDAVLRGRAARVCDTHLDWHDDTQEVQAAFVARLVTPWARRIPVVLGGDLNAEPDRPSMALFYDHSGGRGVFQEVDETDKSYFGKLCPQSASRCRSGEGTDGERKLDYVFLSRRHFTAVEGDAIGDEQVSDHDLLRGAGSWRKLAPHADFSWSP